MTPNTQMPSMISVVVIGRLMKRSERFIGTFSNPNALPVATASATWRRPALTYVQISRETFVEIQPSNANRAPGINHFGVEVDNIEATVARLRKNGVEVTNPRGSGTGAKLANVSAPDGVTIELLELGPE